MLNHLFFSIKLAFDMAACTEKIDQGEMAEWSKALAC
jgi:hypothetical protein